VDAILDTTGGETLQRCLGALKGGGKLVTVSTAPPLQGKVQPVFFYAEVTTARLRLLNPLFERGIISARVGSVLPLTEAKTAHEMLAGAPHKPGKIVLQVS
jgi:NADPH:quinone reductase-like Zn-dependent oxidoreductase